MLLHTSKKKRIGAGILAAIQIYTLVLNNTFGCYLAVLFICIFIPILFRLANIKFSVLHLLPLFMLIAITLFTNPEFIGTNFTQLANDTDNLTDASGSGRWILWKTTFEAILEKPLLGYGPEGMAWVFDAQGLNNDRPHNELLQYAASLGIPGLLCYLSALVLLWRKFWKARKQADLVLLTAACTVVAYFISSLVGNTMFYTTPYYFMFLGLVAGSVTTGISKEQRP
jgi:O-antigen ligase